MKNIFESNHHGGTILHPHMCEKVKGKEALQNLEARKVDIFLRGTCVCVGKWKSKKEM
jgi:hypothetical protein